MSIYHNKTKIYPDLNPIAPQEPQTYRLNKLSELRHFLLMKLKNVNRRQKKNKRLITILSITDTRLIISTVLTARISIAALANGVGLSVGTALGKVSLLFSLMTPITQKYLTASIVAREKRNSIKLLAQGKLDSIVSIISQVMEDGDISPTEFHKIL